MLIWNMLFVSYVTERMTVLVWSTLYVYAESGSILFVSYVPGKMAFLVWSQLFTFCIS